jgi:capsular exopolysaccharide synthesis family protein
MESYNLNNLNFKSDSLIKEYYSLVITNFKFLLILNILIFLIAIVYAFIMPDKYSSAAILKVSLPQGDVFNSQVSSELGLAERMNRFISNELEVLNNPTIKVNAANMAVDTLRKLLLTPGFNYKKQLLKSPNVTFDDIINKMFKDVSYEQKEDLDYIEISAESTSPIEAALMADAYANSYRDFNLSENQKHFSNIKNYIADERDKKRIELAEIESRIKVYKLKGGVVELNAQTSSLISELSTLEAQRNSNNIEISSLQENLNQYKNELRKKDPSLASYLESKANEPYLMRLQDEIARIQTQKDIAASTNNKNDDFIKEYDNKLNELKSKLQKSISDYQLNILSASPSEIKDLTQKIFDTETSYRSRLASTNQLNSVIGKYERDFNTIPEKSIDIARMERDRQTIEKLYLSLENRYQEALVNEKSTPGNVVIMQYASPALKPSKPNRPKIILLGLILGHVLGVTFLFVKKALSKTVKTPEDILNHNVKAISWIPRFSKKTLLNNTGHQLVFIHDPESLATEAFRTLRTRIQYALDDSKVKTMMITSTAPQEGKSTISSNLSVSFAKSNIRTLLIDGDIRAPSIQTIFGIKGARGLAEYLSDNFSIDECTRKSVIRCLDIMVAGKIPPDPSELLSSPKMNDLIKKVRDQYDVVIVDTPPIMTVSDAEVISNYVDLSILVVSANKTELDWMRESIELLKKGSSNFYGVLLNKFDSKSSYHSYYKYYNKDYKKIKRK